MHIDLLSIVTYLQQSGLLTLAAGFIGAKVHTYIANKKTDATHQKLNDLISNAVTTAVTAAIGPTPNGANGDK